MAKPPNSVTTPFNRLKETPGPATPKTIRLWIERLEWLTGVIDPEPFLQGITHTKLRQFASEAAALEVNELLDISRPGKRHTLLLSLLRQAHMHCRDEVIEMMRAGYAGRRLRPKSDWKPCTISTGEPRKR